MQITQEDVDWTVEFWSDVWEQQGKKFASGRILDPKANTSVSIYEFIDGFVMLSGLGGDWKTEMGAFRDALIEKLTDTSKAVAIKEFLDGLNKIDWANEKLVDSQQNVHKYVMQSDHQVITDCSGSFYVWDKATGGCLIQNCETIDMMVLK